MEYPLLLLNIMLIISKQNTIMLTTIQETQKQLYLTEFAKYVSLTTYVVTNSKSPLQPNKYILDLHFKCRVLTPAFLQLLVNCNGTLFISSDISIFAITL